MDWAGSVLAKSGGVRMNKGRKIGPRRYGSGESALMVRELFFSQARVTVKDIQNEVGCCRQTAARLLDSVSLFENVYRATDVKPYEYSISRR